MSLVVVLLGYKLCRFLRSPVLALNGGASPQWTSEVKLVMEDEDDTGRGRIGHAGHAARALPLGRYPRERENGIITVA